MLSAKIMVAYDGSEHSQRALKWALAARPENAPGMDVVTVIPPMAVPASYEIPHMGGMSMNDMSGLMSPDGINRRGNSAGFGDVTMLGADDDPGGPVRVHVQTRGERPACPGCGGPVWAKDQRPVELVDLAAFGRPARLVWHKYRWSCPAAAC